MTALVQLTHIAPVVACDVCNHPDSAHDHIARRYCKATMANALPRRCVCPPLAP